MSSRPPCPLRIGFPFLEMFNLLDHPLIYYLDLRTTVIKSSSGKIKSFVPVRHPKLQLVTQYFGERDTFGVLFGILQKQQSNFWSTKRYQGVFERQQKEHQICPFHQNYGLVAEFLYNCVIGMALYFDQVYFPVLCH